jgi:hypothetical protein
MAGRKWKEGEESGTEMAGRNLSSSYVVMIMMGRSNNRTMKAVQGLLFPSTILLIAICIKGCSSQESASIHSYQCIDLNFQAAALQGGDACKFFNAILDDEDLFAADVSDVETSCSGVTQIGDVENNCVDVVVEVVAGMHEEGCDVTGG